ncbi:metal-dependent hydrolase [Synergistales bacterium]|nr:metal-dependent hydrolase [Synergistales bacterium]
MQAKWEVLDNCLKQMQIVDLSTTLEKGMPRWPTHPPIIIDQTLTHEHDGMYCQTVIFGEHSGSHIDMPSHMADWKMDKTLDAYGPTIAFGPAVKYDVCKFGVKNGERVSFEQIKQLEEEMGDHAGEGEIPVFNFGLQKFWSTDKDWNYYATNQPGLDEETVKLFLERKVRAVGFDSAGGDQPVDGGKESFAYGHRKYWLPNEIFIVENLMNLDQLPTRFYLMLLPLKIKNGSGSPVRPIACF